MISSKSLTWHSFSYPPLHRYTGMVAQPDDSAISICFLRVTSSFTGPKWMTAVPPYSASVLYIIWKLYDDFCLDHGSHVGGFALEGTAFEFRDFDGKSVFYYGPAVTAWNGGGLRGVSVGGQGQGGTWVDKFWFALDVKTVLTKIFSAFGGFALDPVEH